MKIISINNASNASFNGLWEKSREVVRGADGYTTYKDEEWNYHPFADESDVVINQALDSKKYKVTVPGASEFTTEEITSAPKALKKLSFTQKEFTEYKNFYGKVLTESMKNIEKELLEQNLSHHVNTRFKRTLKRFIHIFKR